ncbi:MAG: oligoribonuclease [Desulforhopalus sp.]|nr:oligoribonuclease [Desulforhopalus sp.]
MKDCGNLIWVDLEMTGLNCSADRVLEAATIVTNANLDILAEGPVFAIHQPDEVLDAMDSWNTRQHRESGLLERSRESTCDYRQAEVETLNFIRQWVGYQESPMCGNSICQDRRFLARFMPELENYFHYRNIDVSTLKELAQRWAPHLQKFNKKNRHQACADIKESIDELKYYADHFIKKQ